MAGKQAAQMEELLRHIESDPLASSSEAKDHAQAQLRGLIAEMGSLMSNQAVTSGECKRSSCSYHIHCCLS